jgi:hypothetical protein
MTTAPVGVERRVGQRFPYLLPVSFRVAATGVEGLGFTQDLSSRGAFILTGASLHEGDEIELTLTMPSEITLGESMRVRCRGHILRTVKPADRAGKIPGEALGAVPSPGSVPTPAAEIKIAVAVRFECYEYLPDPAPASAFPRVAVLHPHREEDATGRIPPQR